MVFLVYFPLNLIKLEHRPMLRILHSTVPLGLYQFYDFLEFASTNSVSISTDCRPLPSTRFRENWWLLFHTLTYFLIPVHFESCKQLKWTIGAHFDFSIWPEADLARFTASDSGKPILNRRIHTVHLGKCFGKMRYSSTTPNPNVPT